MAAGSTDDGFTGWLKLNTVGPQSMVPSQLDGADLSTLTLTRTADSESANLGMAASSGTRFACARLDVAAGPGYQRLDYALINAGFVSETVRGNTETLTVTYSSISWNYLPTRASKPTTGSGAINTRPDVKQTSLKRDAQLVAAGVLGLTVVCLLGMLLLTLIGRHRRKVRYRQVRERSRTPISKSMSKQASISMPVPTTASAVALASAKKTVAVSSGAASSVSATAAAQTQPAEPSVPLSTEVLVPEALMAVRVSEFAHTRPAKVAESEAADSSVPGAGVSVDVDVDEASISDSAVGADIDAADVDAADVDVESDADADIDADIDVDSDADVDNEAADEDRNAEVVGTDGEQDDESWDAEGQPDGGVAAGYEPVVEATDEPVESAEADAEPVETAEPAESAEPERAGDGDIGGYGDGGDDDGDADGDGDGNADGDRDGDGAELVSDSDDSSVGDDAAEVGSVEDDAAAHGGAEDDATADNSVEDDSVGDDVAENDVAENVVTENDVTEGEDAPTAAFPESDGEADASSSSQRSTP